MRTGERVAVSLKDLCESEETQSVFVKKQ